MKRATKYSEEERREWKERMTALATKIREMPAEEREALAAKIGTVTPEGHRLSVYNTCFLWTQAGTALAQVGGFRQWNKVGRSVAAGQKAIGYIYVPMGKNKVEDGGVEGGGEETTGRMRFRLVPVWDVTQTVPTEAVEIAA